MKTIKFRRTLAEEILAGRKNVTWRLFDDKDLKVGDRISLIIWESGEKFAESLIMEVREKKLEDITKNDLDGHEKYGSKKEILETYRKYYGNIVEWDTAVKIIRFKIC